MKWYIELQSAIDPTKAKYIHSDNAMIHYAEMHETTSEIYLYIYDAPTLP